jgi:hypothetical protein
MKSKTTKPLPCGDRIINDTSNDEGWDLLKTAEQKAKRDPHKFLREAFPNGSGRPAKHDIVIIKINKHSPSKLADMTEEMGLEAISADAPWINYKKPALDQWIVFGRSRDAVRDQVREIEMEAVHSMQHLLLETKQHPQSRK